MKIPLIVGLSLLHQEILWLLRMETGSTLEGLVCGGAGGGGAGGDGRNATGGGGGGIAYFEVPANGFTATTYPVTVGQGGSGAGGRGSNSNSGTNSSFTGGYSVTGNGGGRGADWDRGPQASPGGSGGGFDTSQYSPSTAGSATQPGANAGFRGFSNNGVTQAPAPTAEILVLPASRLVNTQISSQQLLLLYHLIILTLVQMVLNIMPEDLTQTPVVVMEL